jgi:cyclopropane fatty-acyl-phospholipid synthase-like methyltransferase
MTTSASEWIVWSVNALTVQPDDHILEIGPGHGVAVSLLCKKLVNGTIMAIDRSAKMANAARARNAACVASGKASIYAATLLDADFGPRRFNIIVAMNIGVFWQRPRQELRRIRDLLAPGGRFYLLFRPSIPEKAPLMTAQAIQTLEDGGFVIERTITEPIDGVPAVCIVAQPATPRPSPTSG